MSLISVPVYKIMNFRYFAETDMLYVELLPSTAVESEEVAPNIVLDFDEDERVIGIEIEDASQMIDFQSLELAALPFANLVMRQQEVVPAPAPVRELVMA